MVRKAVLVLWALTITWGALAFVLFTKNGVAERDFMVFWTAGQYALTAPALAYDPTAMAAAKAALPYPPHFLLLLAPLGLLPLIPAYVLWSIAGAAFFAWAARPYLKGWPALLAVLTPAGCFSLYLGQTGLVIGGLWLLAFRRAPWAVGLLTMKPHLAWLAAFTLNRRGVIYASAAALFALGAAAVLFPEAFTAFPAAIQRQAGFLDSKTYGAWNQMVVSPRFHYGILAWLAFAGAALLLLCVRFDAFTAATASLLIAPYAFNYDMTVACLGMGLGLLEERRPAAWVMLFLGFLTPYLVVIGSWVAPPILLGALAVQVWPRKAEREGRDYADRSASAAAAQL